MARARVALLACQHAQLWSRAPVGHEWRNALRLLRPTRWLRPKGSSARPTTAPAGRWPWGT